MAKKTEKTEKTEFLVVGKSYMVRSVTYHYLGRLEAITPFGLEFSSASWLADSGVRMGALLRDGVAANTEIEPFVGRVLVPLGAVVDITEWSHPLPSSAQ